MVTVNQALDAARLLAEWYDRIAKGTQYDAWIAFRVLGVVTDGSTIAVDAGTKTISYDRARLEALQSAWRLATEYVNGSADRWPVWRIHDWRVAIPPLVDLVKNKAALEATGWKPTPVAVTSRPANTASPGPSVAKAAGVGAAVVVGLLVLGKLLKG